MQKNIINLHVINYSYIQLCPYLVSSFSELVYKIYYFYYNGYAFFSKDKSNHIHTTQSKRLLQVKILID
jgi:hypothetical protein